MGLRLFGKGNGNGNGYCTKEEMRQLRGAVEQDLGGLRDRIDSRHLDVIQRLEVLHTNLVADAERRSEMLQKRVAGVEAAVERLDERTCRGRAES